MSKHLLYVENKYSNIMQKLTVEPDNVISMGEASRIINAVRDITDWLRNGRYPALMTRNMKNELVFGYEPYQDKGHESTMNRILDNVAIQGDNDRDIEPEWIEKEKDSDRYELHVMGKETGVVVAADSEVGTYNIYISTL